MHAILIEVEVPSDMDEAASVQQLNEVQVPRVREAGACGGYWFGAGKTRTAVLLFENEETAQALAGLVKIGEQPTGDNNDGVIFSRVEVSEVVASL